MDRVVITVLLAGVATAGPSLHLEGRADESDRKGRFSLRQSGDRWTLVQPDGSPTFLLALNHLAPPFFAGVISGASGLYPCHAYDALCHQAGLFETKYHSNWSAATEDFIAASISWGFNSAGYEFVPATGISWPYIPDLFVTNASHIFARSATANQSFPDVFSGEFNATTDARVSAWILEDQHIGQPRVLQDVVGYYLEDQPIWNVSAARREYRESGEATDWVVAMRGLPGTAPGKVAYVSWLQAHYQDKGGFSAAVSVYSLPPSVQTWEQVRAWPFSNLDVLSESVVADDDLFLGVVADKYFAVACAAIRRHDPAALVFGQRFLGNDAPATVLAAAGRHFDVVSVQPAPFSFDDVEKVEESADNLQRISRLAGGRPVFVADQSTHYYVPPPELGPNCGTPNPHSGVYPGCARNQSEAGQLYRAYLAALRARDAVVGYAHCQYIDRSVLRGGSESPHLKQGLLDFEGHPHETLVAAVAKANREVGQ